MIKIEIMNTPETDGFYAAVITRDERVMHTQGETLDECFEMIKDVLDLWGYKCD